MATGPTRFAPAKVNLFLHVGERRPDGYHDLKSLAVFAAVGDTLSLTGADKLSLDVAGPMSKGLETDDRNLVLKAAHALGAWARQNGHKAGGAHLILDKHLPLASGIGGGSSDAAAALHLLVAHWSLPIKTVELDRIANAVGADVPVCLRAQPSWMSGTGDVVEAAPSLPPFHLVLVNPRVHVPTADVFRRLQVRSGAHAPLLPPRLSLREFAAWLDRTVNDLSAPARMISPAVMQAEQALVSSENCLLARMSGSGATCFGLYPDEQSARAGCLQIRSSHPDWWVEYGQQHVPA
jgi:4-diphosphocytidyl-2-C-methyl-D-erythritol kinase